MGVMKTSILSVFLLSAGASLCFAGSLKNYAGWVQHGAAYLATGQIDGETQQFKVKIIRKGKRYIVRTPLGDHALKPRGKGVSFKIRIEKSWANIQWNHRQATVRYKNKVRNVELRRIEQF